MRVNVNQICQVNNRNNLSLRRMSADIGRKKLDTYNGSIPSECRLSNEMSTAQSGTITNLIQFEMNKKQDCNINSTNNVKSEERYYSKSSLSNLNEECIQDNEETKGILTHSLQTKRNSLMREKENQFPLKPSFDEGVNWKQKYHEIQQFIQQKNKEQFIQQRTIQELQTKLVNEKNKAKFYEKSQDIFNSLQSQLDESNLQRKQIEDRLQQLLQQNELLKNQLQHHQSSSQKLPLHQIISNMSTPTSSSSSSYVSLRKKSLEGRYSMSNVSKERKNRQSLSNTDNKIITDSNQIKILQANELYNATQQNKTLLLKISELEQTKLSLLEKQAHQEHQLETLTQENSVIQGKLTQYTQILNQIGFFQFEGIRDNLLNQIPENQQNILRKQCNVLEYQHNINDFAHNRNVSDIPIPKNEHYESVSDQSISCQLSNISQQIFQNQPMNSLQHPVHFKDIQPRSITPILMNMNINQNNDHQQLRKQLDYPYLDEIQFVQDNGENTHRLSKLCSC